MIAIFDYGAGNLRSVQNTLGELGCNYTLVRDSAGLQSATKILLPGVGHLSPLEAPRELAAAITTAISKIR